MTETLASSPRSSHHHTQFPRTIRAVLLTVELLVWAILSPTSASLAVVSAWNAFQKASEGILSSPGVSYHVFERLLGLTVDLLHTESRIEQSSWTHGTLKHLMIQGKEVFWFWKRNIGDTISQAKEQISWTLALEKQIRQNGLDTVFWGIFAFAFYFFLASLIHLIRLGDRDSTLSIIRKRIWRICTSRREDTEGFGDLWEEEIIAMIQKKFPTPDSKLRFLEQVHAAIIHSDEKDRV